MVDAVRSGYQAAAQTVTWTANGPDTLVADAWTDASDDIDNSTTKYLMADFTLSITCPTTQMADGDTVAMYIIPQVEDDVDAAWQGADSTAAAPENEPYYVGSFTFTTGTSAQRANLRDVTFTPGKFNIGIRNLGAGTTTAATLKWRPHGFSSQ